MVKKRSKSKKVHRFRALFLAKKRDLFLKFQVQTWNYSPCRKYPTVALKGLNWCKLRSIPGANLKSLGNISTGLFLSLRHSSMHQIYIEKFYQVAQLVCKSAQPRDHFISSRKKTTTAFLQYKFIPMTALVQNFRTLV